MKRALLLGVAWCVAACGESPEAGPTPVARVSAEGARDHAVSVSPDGRQVAFWRRGDAMFDLWVADADLANARALGVSSLFGEAFPPVWSSDGTRLLVPTSAGSLSDVAIVDLASGAVTQLTDAPTLQIPIAFHPDGDRVLFVAYGEGGTVRTYTVSLVTRELVTMLAEVDEPLLGILSPDGAHLVHVRFSGGSSTIWISATDGGAEVQVTSEGYETPAFFQGSSIWSPDGRSFLYLSNRTGKPDIWIADLDGSTRQLTADINADEFPTWSPDGRWVAFRSQRGRQSDIWVVPSVGGEPRRVTDDALTEGPPAWLDDSTIVYTSARSPGTLWRRAIGDTIETRILPDTIDAGALMESPDRQWLAFEVIHPGGGNDLAVIRLDGSGLRVLARGADFDNFRWDRSSTRLAWTTNERGNLDVHFADPGAGEPPTTIEGWPGFERPGYWSADGTALVIVADRDSRLGDLWRIPLGAGDTTRLTRHGAILDAASVVSDDRDQPVVTVSDSATGEIVVAALLPNGRLRPLLAGANVIKPINQLLASGVVAGGGVTTVVYRYDGTVLHRLENAGGPNAFSPDDRRLLLAMPDGGQFDIAMLDIATGGITRLTRTSEDETNMAFTAGGDSMVFRRVRVTSEIMRADVSRILR